MSSTTFAVRRRTDVEYLRVGETAVGYRSEILRHADTGEISPAAPVLVVDEQPETLAPGQATVIRTDDGWLVDGALFTYTCYDHRDCYES